MSEINIYTEFCNKHLKRVYDDCPYCEIDRLTKELAEARKLLADANRGAERNATINRLLSERGVRYREALERILTCGKFSCECCAAHISIARGALEEQPFATTCGDCGNELEAVRPGKHQCNHCEGAGL